MHGGTLFGAECNGHLIHWDDDAEISMMCSQFKKLKKTIERRYCILGIQRLDFQRIVHQK